MFPSHISVLDPDEFSRCEERSRVIDRGKSLSPIRKSDAALKESIYLALWGDDVLRALEYDEIEVRVHTGIVHVYGHIVSGTSQNRVMNAIRNIPGIAEIQNHLVLDDQLTLEAATSLAGLEHAYDCKFFTGASHGVISMDGMVRDSAVKALAEKQVAGNPKVRGVINHVRIKGSGRSGPGEQSPPFLQAAIGETIYFLDGISGIVKQVIINPDNRLVIAMTLHLKVTDRPWQEPTAPRQGSAGFPELQITVPMSVVRYLTRDSGFLSIKSSETKQYLDFDPTSFSPPGSDWVPPYPYCPNDVLFPMKQPVVEDHLPGQVSPSSLTAASKEKLFREQLLANDSLGG